MLRSALALAIVAMTGVAFAQGTTTPPDRSGSIGATGSTGTDQNRGTDQGSGTYDRGTQGSTDNQNLYGQTGSDEENETADVSTEHIIQKLHSIDQFEIEMGQLAQQKAQSEEVKSFADMLVTDHQEADRKLVDFAKKKGINLPPIQGFSENQATTSFSGLPKEKTDVSGQVGTSGSIDKSGTGSGSVSGSVGDRSGSVGGSTSGSVGDRSGSTSGSVGATGSVGDQDKSNPSYGTSGTTDKGSTYGQSGALDKGSVSGQAGVNGKKDWSARQEKMQKEMADARKKLESVSGEEFDRNFLVIMQFGHAKAVRFLERCQNRIQDSELKSLVQGLIPTLKTHLETCSRLLVKPNLEGSSINSPTPNTGKTGSQLPSGDTGPYAPKPGTGSDRYPSGNK